MRVDRAELVAVFAGGFAGAVARAAVGEALAGGGGRWPWATLLVNVTGAALLGWVVARVPPGGWRRPLLGTGFCGALTTFSTMQLELLNLLDDGRVALAGGYVAASVGAGLLAVTIAGRGVRDARGAT